MGTDSSTICSSCSKDTMWHMDKDKLLGEGACRIAYEGRYCRSVGTKVFSRCVIKKFKEEHVFTRESWERDIASYDLARELCAKWNECNFVTKKFEVVDIHMSICTKGKSSGSVREIVINEYCLVEDYIEGNFEKWNSNSGYCSDSSLSIQAFCHWTYHYTNGKILLCDAQGVRRDNKYILSDPCILSEIPGNYGKTDLGISGIEKWFYHHSCNNFCQIYWKKPSIRSDLSKSFSPIRIVTLGLSKLLIETSNNYNFIYSLGLSVEKSSSYSHTYKSLANAEKKKKNTNQLKLPSILED